VDGVARRIIDAAGHGERFGHGLGHGVGLEIHEDPRLTRVAEGMLREGNTVTIEPGIYLPGSFGVRIEDLVAITADVPEVLTAFPKELVTVGCWPSPPWPRLRERRSSPRPGSASRSC
jgi:Xaa-Pro aminopeptidase